MACPAGNALVVGDRYVELVRFIVPPWYKEDRQNVASDQGLIPVDQLCCPNGAVLSQAGGPERDSISLRLMTSAVPVPPSLGLHRYLGTGDGAESKFRFPLIFGI
jgi:hypothetical protein